PKLLKNFEESKDSVLLFFHQKENPFIIKSSVGIEVPLSLILTDGKDQGINGDCLYFLKSEDTPNFSFGRLRARCSEEGSMAAVVNSLLKNVYMPSFSIGSDWTKNKLNAEKNRNACLDSFNHFIEYIK
ncbi:unnamed protein product, partial [Larinioides sclopetarius]